MQQEDILDLKLDRTTIKILGILIFDNSIRIDIVFILHDCLMSNTLCRPDKSRLLFLVLFSSLIFMTATTPQSSSSSSSSSFQPAEATPSSITLPQNEGDNEQQHGQEQTDTALGNQMELLAPSNTTINNATSPNDLMFDRRAMPG